MNASTAASYKAYNAMAELNIISVNQLLEIYKSGQRLFIDIEFENNESLHGQNLSGSTFICLINRTNKIRLQRACSTNENTISSNSYSDGTRLPVLDKAFISN